VKSNRLVALSCLAVAGVLAMAACGSDNNSTSNPPSSSAGGTSPSSASGGSSPSASSTSTTGGSISCAKGTLQLAGSTAQTNAMSAWTKAYQTACKGSTIDYGGGGSGQGVQNFTDGTVDFAGSDFPLTSSEKPDADKRCKAGPAIDLPMVPGPIAVGFNLPGIKTLNLSASNLAKMFSGKITKWDDSAIKTDNPGVTLPPASIQAFHRSDGSGTSFNFSNYLANDAKADWSYGANKQWPAPGGQGEKGTSAVAQGVKSTPGGIGYMELSYATQNQISYAKVGNAQGKFVELTTANVVNFLSKATVAAGASGQDLPLSFDYANTDPNAYPSVLVTYEIVCQKGNPAAKVSLIKGFLTYLASDQGQGILPQNGYVKLPTNVQSKVQAALAVIG